MNIKHSTLEEYFESVHPKEVVSRQFLALRKSYSSAREIKKAHDDLENQISFSEKLGTLADLSKTRPYNRPLYIECEKDLAEIEFHDVLSGTAIKRGTLQAIDKARGATVKLKEESFKAFASLAEHLPPAAPNDSEFVIYNPHPYEYTSFIETEILAVYPNEKEDQRYEFTLKDEEGNLISNQIISEDSNINFDRRKRILYKTTLQPMEIKAIHVHYEIKPVHQNIPLEEGKDLTIVDSKKKVVISKDTGAIKELVINGTECLSAPSFIPVRFDDNEDPWGWGVKKLGSNFQNFALDHSSAGIFTNLKAIETTENGPLLTSIQCLYSLNEFHIIVTYKFYKDVSYIDINIHVLWNEAKKGLKFSFSPRSNPDYFAQMAFGQEEYKNNGEEYPCGRYVGTRQGKESFFVINNGGIRSVSKLGNEISLTLLNGSAYCAHPSFIDGRPIIPNQKKFVDFIEQGVHDFSLRVDLAPTEEVEKEALEFNEQPYSLEFFPHNEGKEFKDTLIVSNPNIVVSAFKKLKYGNFLIRLFNGSDVIQSSILTCKGLKITVKLNKFEFESFIYDGDSIITNIDNGIY
jgi:alpha-mannosidase